MYILSQNRQLLMDFEGFNIKEYSHSTFMIIGYTSSDEYSLGTYKSMERAKEVLQEIHKQLKAGTIEEVYNYGMKVFEGVKLINSKDIKHIVYEMPLK